MLNLASLNLAPIPPENCGNRLAEKRTIQIQVPLPSYIVSNEEIASPRTGPDSMIRACEP